MLKTLIAAAALLAAATASAETYAVQAGRLIVDAARPAVGPSTVIVETAASRESKRASWLPPAPRWSTSAAGR